MKPYYDADGIQIYHGDALDVLKEFRAESFDNIFTDPPYSSGARQASQLRSRRSMRSEDGPFPRDRWFGSDNLTSLGFQMLVRLFAVEALRTVKRDGHLFSFIDWRQLPVLQGCIEAAGWSPRALLVWDKDSMGMGNGFRHEVEFVLFSSKGIGNNFLRHDVGTIQRAPRVRDPGHPTPKPVNAIERWLSAVPGSVCDPFMGSARILVAARRLGRHVVGIDNREDYCEQAALTLSQGDLFGSASFNPRGLTDGKADQGVGFTFEGHADGGAGEQNAGNSQGEGAGAADPGDGRQAVESTGAGLVRPGDGVQGTG